ncbi:transposase-like protein [Rhizobium sp. BK491]|nr:transposase-like protein [Rhizobium sp. BK491]
MKSSAVSYKNHRFPPQIIAYAVWLYFRFSLSLRLVEEMLLERGRCHLNLNSVVREMFCLGG